MKILIVSDNHGRTGNLEQVIKEQGNIDYFLHAGDTEGSEDYIEALLDCPSAIVGGNNDYFSGLPSELMVNIGKYKVWITHGHMYSIYMGYGRIEKEMNRRGADFAVVGHTHMPKIEWCGDKAIVNPGSISLPRQPGRKPSYVIMEIDREEQVHFTVCYL
ncbi:MAG: metallophosphoesterase [Lachnospiraceae bacterium]|nr:metallophosphoesterase [Lachnospiraceae bacterium]